eukprot:16443042-Heterocapsa_arctica.AAC.1
MMSPAVAKHWWAQERRPLFCESGRIVAVEVVMLGRTYYFASVYAPHSSKPTHERKQFYSDLTEQVARATPKAQRVVGGDWNASLKSDAAGRHGCGRWLLPG